MMDLQVLRESYDWASVFGEENWHNCDAEVISIDDAPTDRFTREDVSAVLAVDVAQGYFAETECWGIFQLRDGRYLAACGNCDTTGWDCQANNSLTVGYSLVDVINKGIGEEGRRRLRLHDELVPPSSGFNQVDLLDSVGRKIMADYWEENGYPDKAELLRS